MNDLIKGILTRLNKDALVIIIMAMGGYIVNDKISKGEKDAKDDRIQSLEYQVRTLNYLFEMKNDTLKQTK